MREVIELRTGRATAPLAIGARPALAGDGVDVTSWRPDGKRSPRDLQLFIAGTVAASITAPGGGTVGVELWGYKLGAWWFNCSINGANAVPIAGAGQGYAQPVYELGDFDRLAIAGTVSAGSASVVFAPLERNMY